MCDNMTEDDLYIFSNAPQLRDAGRSKVAGLLFVLDNNTYQQGLAIDRRCATMKTGQLWGKKLQCFIGAYDITVMM
jgi:hypothetical protein